MTTNREKSTKIAITARNKDESDILHEVVKACGFEQMQAFSNPRVTLEVAKRNQFQIFITHNEFPDLTGLSMIQSLRATGNYGVELHLFLVDELTPEIMLVLTENNIDHVLNKPFTAARIGQKLSHLWQGELDIKPAESDYRDAHAAMNSGLLEMAFELGIKNLGTHGPSEKLLLMLGDIQAKLDQPTEARRYYNAAQQYNPNSSAAAHKLAQTYMLEKNFARAAELMNNLVKLNQLNLELLANTGLSNFEIRNFEQAKNVMKRLHSLDKERKDASEILAKVAIHDQDYATALQHLKGTHDKKELIQTLNNEGLRLSRDNNVTAAIDMYTQSIELIGENPYIYALFYNLGLSYLKQHDSANAKKWFRKAVEAKPDFEKAVQALARLEPKSA